MIDLGVVIALTVDSHFTVMVNLEVMIDLTALAILMVDFHSRSWMPQKHLEDCEYLGVVPEPEVFSNLTLAGPVITSRSCSSLRFCQASRAQYYP